MSRRPLSCGHDGVNDLHDAMKSRVGPDGHVGATEVVVYGADEPDYVQMAVLLCQRVCDPS